MDNFVLLASKVVSVTVFRSGARVMRSCEIAQGEAGFPQTVSVSNLPLSMEDGSVRVIVKTSENKEPPVARDFRVVLDTVPGAFEPLSSLQNELLSARREVSQSERLLKKWSGFKKALLSSKLKGRPEGRRGEPPLRAPVESRLLWLTFRRNRLLGLEHRIAKQKAVHRELVDRQDALEAKLKESSDARAPRATELRKALRLTLDAHQASSTTATVYIEYLVPGAQWGPCYGLSLKQASGEVRLSLRAAISQKTGEDWTGVAVALSTALPHRFTPLPELKALRVGKRQPSAKRRALRPTPNIESLYADYDAAIGKIPDPQPARQAVAKSEASVEWAPGAGPTPPPMAAPMPTKRRWQASVEPVAPKQAAPHSVQPSSSFSLESNAVISSTALQSRGGGPPPLRIADEPTESAPDASLLDFGSLRMVAPSAALRGKVAPMSLKERYVELLAFQKVEINVDITQMIQAAVCSAEKVAVPPLATRGLKPDRLVGFDCIYRGDHRADIPSDGQLHTISLTHADASATLHHISVPRESMQVFRCLTFASPFPFPLLPGPVEVSSDGRVLPSAEIDATPECGEAVVWLGVEQHIKISRNADYREESTGLLRGQISLFHAIDLKLINHLPHVADIEVRERIPVAKEGEDDIKVAVKTVEPTWHAYEQKEHPLTGGFAWKLSLKPKEERRLLAEYTVTIPAKHQLVGGNRREA